jgi:hypothetical protein
VIVRKWWTEGQDFIKIIDEDEENRITLEQHSLMDIGYIKGVKNMQFDRSLGPYPMENYQAWQEVSNYISQVIISKLEV